MSEERLFEIASEISKLDGPLWIMFYVSSLSDDEIGLFLKCVDNSKYRKLNIYEALYAFSRDYLRSRGVMIESFFADSLERKVKENIDIYNQSEYFQSWHAGEKESNNKVVKR